MITIYCGWYRTTQVKIKPKLKKDIFIEIPCMECNGSGWWDYAEPLVAGHNCNVCKGTGKMYVGMV